MPWPLDPRIHTDLAHLAGLEDRARGFDFLPRQPVGSVLSGRRAARVRGRGLEFEEIRAYLPGDDVRAIDWKVTARTGSPHVRVTREERDRPALILVDQRQAMFFGVAPQHEVRHRRRGRRARRLAHPRRRRPGRRPRPLRRRPRRGPRPAAAAPPSSACSRLVADRNAALSATAPAVPDAPALPQPRADPGRAASSPTTGCSSSSPTSTAPTTPRCASSPASPAATTWSWPSSTTRSAHELPEHGRIVVGDGRMQVELDLADARVRRNLAAVGGDRLKQARSPGRTASTPRSCRSAPARRPSRRSCASSAPPPRRRA